MAKHDNGPTLTDLAEELGLSKATVSYALNGRRGVSEATRQRILELARSRGYRQRQVNTDARRPGSVVGVVLSPTRSDDSPNYYVSQLLSGAEEEFRAGNIAVLVSAWSGSAVPATFQSAGVEGMLYLGGSLDLDLVATAPLPTTLVGTFSPGWQCDAVLADNRRGAYLATRHLIDLGRRRIAFINGPDTTSTSDAKLLGFQDALTEAGQDPRRSVVARGDFSVDSGYAVAHRIFQTQDDRPDAVFVADDPMAMGAIHALADLGLDIPRDVAVIGFGNSDAGRISRPSLSTIDVFQTDLGRLGARMLLERLSGSQEPYRQVLVCPQLVSRGSTLMPAT